MKSLSLLVVFAAAISLAGMAIAEDEDHPFGPRPPKDAPAADLFAADSDAKPDKDDDAPAGFDNPFGDLPDEAFEVRPAVVRPDTDPKPMPEEKKPGEEKLQESNELTLDLDGDNNISDRETLTVIENAIADAKSRGERGDRVRKLFDQNGDGKAEPAEIAQVVVEYRVANDKAAAEVANVFVELDVDKDQQVDPVEFLALGDKIGIPPALSVHILKGRFESLDRDRDSKVSYIEAIIMAEDITAPWGRGEATAEDDAAMVRVKEVMKELDRDENNELSQREAARNDGLKQYFAAIDANRSETLDIGEMYDFLRAQAKQAEQQQKIQKRREALERFGKGGRGFGRDKRD